MHGRRDRTTRARAAIGSTREGRPMTPRNLLFTLVGLIAGLLAASQIPLHARRSAQEPAEKAAPTPVGTAGVPNAEPKVSLQEALLRPYAFDFAQPTPLEEAARRLSADLGGEVVLDLAALDRMDVRKEDPVELTLKNGRLKTGLKLLLDQVELTYKLVPEDNLLIITYEEGSEDPLDKVWAELGHIHRELHDIQDALDEVLDRAAAGDDVQLHQPTIIEEMPGMPGAAPADPGEEPAAPQEESPAPKPRTRT